MPASMAAPSAMAMASLEGPGGTSVVSMPSHHSADGAVGGGGMGNGGLAGAGSVHASHPALASPDSHAALGAMAMPISVHVTNRVKRLAPRTRVTTR